MTSSSRRNMWMSAAWAGLALLGAVAACSKGHGESPYSWRGTSTGAAGSDSTVAQAGGAGSEARPQAQGWAGSAAHSDGGAGSGVPTALAPARKTKPIQGDRYRGFNLIGMYAVQWSETNQGFEEESFSMMSELGFNFARLPLDYRSYTPTDDWLAFDPRQIGRLDDAVTWGQEYGIHVNLCLHRAPGFCVHDWDGRIVDLPEEQDLDLWHDEVAQKAFVAHWRMLAERYRDIPSEYLSFNLVNEPIHVEDATYISLMQRAIDAIRDVSPDRTIVVDGLDTAKRPIVDDDFLAIDNVIQSRHAYDFERLQYYATEFTPGSADWPAPHWPPLLLPEWLCGPYQDGLDYPLVIRGEFPKGTEVTLNLGEVNYGATLEIRTDKETLVREVFRRTADDADWESIGVYDGQEVFAKTYNQDFTGSLTQAATELSFEVTELNMLRINSITIDTKNDKTVLTPSLSFGAPQATFQLHNGTLVPVEIPEGGEQYYDLGSYLDDWRDVASRGARVMIGEWLMSGQVPHEDALRFAEFMLSSFEDAGFGYAYWDFDSTNPRGCGAFLDNGRTDITPVDFRGHEVDQEMLDLFQAH